MDTYANVALKAAPENPFEVNFQDLLSTAAFLGASDLHIEPFSGTLRIRARVDGLLRIIQEVPQQRFAERLLQQIKRTCRFDMGKLDIPQDSRFSPDHLNYDVRASLIPTLHGEKIVLRLLERGRHFSLDAYPLNEDAKQHLRSALSEWQGLILVSGPTGSGKTTLLYSALSETNPLESNIHTLEDPVEYTLPGVIQTPIGELTFSAALTALMRQDPDVILIGEIRDESTAKAALQAASTGHLVLSTIHANSAREILDRLSELGLSHDRVHDVLLFASAQRLVPRNCPTCKTPDSSYGPYLDAGLRTEFFPMRGQGCDSCGYTGIKGRELIFEYMFREKSRRRLETFGSLADSLQEALKRGDINASQAQLAL
jgi:type II secretory ATPase GspE/PulE/Tfp pilus assembly ATPase PilB-like protein